ncbi:MAG: hypothetical protein GIKADHBN_02675 [Phycisphaerales bacterium]|nr:hypothetical protein [Phycisphaerales bacterium]
MIDDTAPVAASMYCARRGVIASGYASAGPQPREIDSLYQFTPGALSWSARFGGSQFTPPDPYCTGKSGHARLIFSLLTKVHAMPSLASTGISRVLNAISDGNSPRDAAGVAPHASG